MKKIFVSILACLLVLALCTTALAGNVLQTGDKGEEVKKAQTLLKAYGFYTGSLDGVYGPRTARAVENFQKVNGLTVDGKIGPKTNAVLTSGGAAHNTENLSDNPTAADASQTAAIKSAQTLLKKYGYYAGKINGQLDDDTVAAIREFQKYNGLKQNGQLDAATETKLNGAEVVKAPIRDKATANKDDVKHVQERLTHYGFYTLEVDGLYGSGTINAVKAFQAANGLKADGVVGPATLAKLDSDDAVSKTVLKDKETLAAHPTLRPGDKGDYVKEAQQKLTAAGFYTGEINGKMDDATVAAVKAYQESQGIEADGKVGPYTWGKLLGLSEASLPEVVVPEVRTVLRPGDEGDDVKHVQERLAHYGFYTGTADGVYGNATLAAVKAFQAANGLAVDGKAGPATIAKLDADDSVSKAHAAYPTLRPGDKKNVVEEAQMKLKTAGFYTGELTGVMDEATVAAVKAFQTANGLEADGKVGPLTWAKLLGEVPQAQPEQARDVLRPGDQGDDVKAMQQELIQLGYDIVADGKYGPKTTAAVKDFQKKNNLDVDGKVGPKTKQVLDSLTTNLE